MKFNDIVKAVWPFLVSIFFGGTSFWLGLRNWDGQGDNRPIAIGGFIFLTSLVISEHVKTTGLIRNQTEDINRSVRTLKEFEFVGPAADSFAGSLDRHDIASEIRNALICFETGNEGFLRDQAKQIQNKIEDLLKARKRWIDIVSPETLASKELGWIDFALRMKSNPNYRYYLYCLRASYPCVNFTITRNKSVSQQVMFRWGHHPNELDGNIFASTQDEVLSSFDTLWNTLINDSIEVDPRKVSVVSERSIAGPWLTVAYKVDGTLSNYAFVEISSRDRHLEITGKLLDIDGKRIKEGEEFVFKSAHIVTKRLWFASEYLGKFTLGWYNFGGDDGKIDHFDGHLNPGPAEDSVFGVRLDDEEAEKMTRDVAQRRQVITSNKLKLERLSEGFLHSRPLINPQGPSANA